MRSIGLYIAAAACILLFAPCTTAEVAPTGRGANLDAVLAGTRRRLAATMSSACWPEWGGATRSVIFVADPGFFSNTPEDAVYVANLAAKFKKLKPGQSGCPIVYFGQIMKQDVAVITTGIGQDAAAMCVFEVLLRCSRKVKDVVYSGTSGWSPQLGGILNNGTCEQGKANGNGKITRVGDVCVSPFAVNWNCRQASWTMTAGNDPNQCTFPAQNYGPGNSALFGDCLFAGATAKTSLPLADELIAAATPAMAPLGPARPAALQTMEQQYWAMTANATQEVYPPITPTATPHVWNYKECMEIASQYFWSGNPWDMVARKYVADTLNAAYNGTGVKFTQGDVIAVSAMESVGVAGAFQRYASLTGAKPIPYTIVRGMSNVAVQPVVRGGAPGVWLDSGAEFEDFVNGYAYAIKTASTAVMSLLQQRCLATPAGKKSPASCTFKV